MPFVFDLDHDHRLPPAEVAALVGGKAANLGVMTTRLHLPVPPGFVVSTAACRLFLAEGWPDELDDELRAHMTRTEELSGHRFGGAVEPLLVSVRSGAAVSMPGMMDTILNLGLNDLTTEALADTSGSATFARDCRERFVSMFASIVGSSPPEDPWEQLRAAVAAVFSSWNSERARGYRKVEGLSDDLGTAVTVQAMVFGNGGSDSGTGVLFTRNPATGERALFGDVLFDAQGEDVVSGRRQTFPVAALAERMPQVAESLTRSARVLERHYADMCDIEFTIERGKLWLLQVRVGKRSPQAALRLAVEMAEDPDFPLEREEAVRRVGSLLANPPRLLAGQSKGLEPITRGLPASPGLAVGEIVTSAVMAETLPAGRPLILVRNETSPEDVPAMARAAGVLTSRGGVASHAAVVARGWAIPAVVGAGDVVVDDAGFAVGARRFSIGETITIDGSTGEVFRGKAAIESAVNPDAIVLLEWAGELGVDLPHPGQTRSHAGTDRLAALRPVSEADVLRSLSIKGNASADDLAVALMAAPERVGKILDSLIEAGSATFSSSAVRLTETGERQAAATIESDRQLCGTENALAALDAFVSLDDRVKSIVTSWQLRTIDGQQLMNDHLDAAYDAGVLADLESVHAEVSGWFSSLGGMPAHLDTYRDRLQAAVAEATAGDRRFVASPLVDSYHGIWFELHEALIRLSGRSREDEVSSGRA